MNNAYLLLGGNEGNIRENFAHAQERIQQKCGKIISASMLYQSEPWGFTSDQLFINQALFIDTFLDPDNLLKELLKIEQLAGRIRKGKGYSSRSMDIDILFYDDLILEKEHLIIPHPRLHLRNFALIPLNELASGFIHPVFNQSISQLKDICPDQSTVITLGNQLPSNYTKR
jgi:2-amino-4-hydroxy-6-hydroxymethyldihydropteridine diphosphokinase